MSIGKSSGDRSSRVDLGDLSLIRYTTHGKRLELIVNPEKAWLYKQGEDVPLEDICEGFTIFENISKGLKANVDDLKDIFGVQNEKEMAKLMIERGELLITQEQRNKFLKEKRDEILEYLVTHAVNPKTKSPQPIARIEKAMEDAGVRIDRNEPAPDQARKIITEIQSILPITIETATIEYIIPPKDTGKLYGLIQGSGEVLKEEWGNDGTLTILSKVPAGLVGANLEKVRDVSKGRVRSTVIDRTG